MWLAADRRPAMALVGLGRFWGGGVPCSRPFTFACVALSDHKKWAGRWPRWRRQSPSFYMMDLGRLAGVGTTRPSSWMANDGGFADFAVMLDSPRSYYMWGSTPRACPPLGRNDHFLFAGPRKPDQERPGHSFIPFGLFVRRGRLG